MKEIVNKQKAPKDILLNSILKEISDENGGNATQQLKQPKDGVQKVKKSKKKKKTSWLNILFYSALAILIFITFVIFSLIDSATDEIKVDQPKKPNVTTIVTPVESSKTIEIDLITEKKEKEVKKIEKSNEIFTSSPNSKEQNVIRQKAKEALLEQMKN